MRIVFMGTPDFAAASLKKLIDKKYDIAAVFTQPDKPRDRGMKLSYSPVKELALENNIPVYQPTKLRDGTATELIKSLDPDILVVVAYGRILPDDMLEVPKYGAINVHASLLPKYRGAAPIQWAVLNGDKITGVTTMYLASEMDTGDIIYTSETEIGEFETSGELFDRLMIMGAELLDRTLRDIEAGTLDGKVFKIYSAEYTQNKTDKAPGSVVSAGKKGIEIACLDGETVLITELQAAGKKRMKASDYLLGHPIKVD